jgi:hypothetical protein
MESEMSKSKKKSWLSVWNILILGFFLYGILSIIYSILLNPSKQSPNRLPSPMINFMSKKYNFSIDHPESWPAFETPQGNHGDMDVIGIIYVPQNSTTSLIIASRNFEQGRIENVVQWGLDRAMRCQEFQQRDRGSDTIAGLSGAKFEYTCLKRTNFFLKTFGTVKCTDFYIIKATTGYALSSCALFDQWIDVEPVLEQMIRSFSIR